MRRLIVAPPHEFEFHHVAQFHAHSSYASAASMWVSRKSLSITLNRLRCRDL